eukprot:Em0025g104a
MTEAQGSSKKTQLIVDEKRIIARRKVETGHSKNVVAAWFKRKTGKKIHPFREMETEGVETIAEIAARLLGRETAEEDDGEPDSNYVEPLPVTLEEAKRISLCHSEFVETI